MKKYAYKVVRYEFPAEAEQRLNELGEQGWRVISTCAWGSNGAYWTLERVGEEPLR